MNFILFLFISIFAYEERVKAETVRNFIKNLLDKTQECKASIADVPLPDAYVTKTLLADANKMLNNQDPPKVAQVCRSIPASLPTLCANDLEKIENLLVKCRDDESKSN